MRRRDTSNEYLKQCIADALLQLMLTKRIDDITIVELAALADVSRMTYYRNFSSKEDVMRYKLDAMCEQWFEGMRLDKTEEPEPMTLRFFTYTKSMQDLLTLLYGAGLEGIVMAVFYRLLGPQEEDVGAERYKKAFFAYALFGLVTEWVSHDMEETPEELTQLAVRELFPPPPCA